MWELLLFYNLLVAVLSNYLPHTSFGEKKSASLELYLLLS